VHLGERDCSIQRRNQKIVEEWPVAIFDRRPAQENGQGFREARPGGRLRGARGTLEFLVDKRGNFYFMEMNTRIQVEHTVTEESVRWWIW